MREKSSPEVNSPYLILDSIRFGKRYILIFWGFEIDSQPRAEKDSFANDSSFNEDTPRIPFHI